MARQRTGSHDRGSALNPRMPLLSWSTFVARHPASHLVIASLPADSAEIGTTLVRNLKGQIGLFIGRLDIAGAYALTIMRSEGTAEILVGFESRADADALAGAVQAKKTGRFPEWASRKLFVLDEAQSFAQSTTKSVG